MSSKIVYQNTFLTLKEDAVIDPNGNQTRRNLLEVGQGSVIIIALDEKDRFYLVGQERYAIKEFSWEFVSGGIKDGEAVLVAAKRELAEELKLQAADWQQLIFFHPNNSLMSRTAYVFLARDLHKIEQASDSYEKIEVKTLSEKELMRSFLNGEIKDSFTLCGYLAYRLNKEVDR